MATTNETQSEDADNAEAEDAAAAPAAKRKFPLKLIMMVVGGLVAVGGIGGGALLLPLCRARQAKRRQRRESDQAGRFHRHAGRAGEPVDRRRSERTQYLKVKVVLELPDQAMSAQIQPVMPRLMDTFQTYLRELRPTDLDGSAGLYRLKEELTRRVNAAIAPSRINAVLFKEIVIQ